MLQVYFLIGLVLFSGFLLLWSTETYKVICFHPINAYKSKFLLLFAEDLEVVFSSFERVSLCISLYLL